MRYLRQRAALALLMVVCAGGCSEHGPTSKSVGAPSDSRGRPNIILILADDLGVEVTGTYGGEIETPGLDALARDGVRFENAHASPLCTPSRVRLLTGQYSFRNYKAFGHLAEGEVAIAEDLASVGYATGVAGKWQLSGGYLGGPPGATPADAGFDESFVWHGPGDEEGCRYWSPTLQLNGHRQAYPGEYGPDLVNDYALDFVRRHAGEPFFLFYSMILPHDPFLPTTAGGNPGDDDANFRPMVAYLDALVTGLRDELEAQGIAENTLVVFLSDNGTHPAIELVRDGTVTRGGKGTTLDTGTHVPLLAAWPAVLPGGSTFDGMVDLVDIYSTIMAAATVDSRARSGDGFDLLPSIVEGADWPRTAIFMDFALNYWNLDPTIYAFDRRWKLYADGRLFDLRADPDEVSPLAGVASGSEAASARIRLRDILDRVDFTPLTIEDDYFPDDFDPGKYDFAAIAAERRARQEACALQPGAER